MKRRDPQTIEKEQIAPGNQSFPEITSELSSSTPYQDEIAAKIKSNQIETPLLNGNTIPSNTISKHERTPKENGNKALKANSVDSKVNLNGEKPRVYSKNDLNGQKCLFSPFAYHRFTRSHKEKTKDGDIHMVLRCRYCFDMVSVRISFVLKDGKYIAIKETVPVEEGKR